MDRFNLPQVTDDSNSCFTYYDATTNTSDNIYALVGRMKNASVWNFEFENCVNLLMLVTYNTSTEVGRGNA